MRERAQKWEMSIENPTKEEISALIEDSLLELHDGLKELFYSYKKDNFRKRLLTDAFYIDFRQTDKTTYGKYHAISLDEILVNKTVRKMGVAKRIIEILDGFYRTHRYLNVFQFTDVHNLYLRNYLEKNGYREFPIGSGTFMKRKIQEEEIKIYLNECVISIDGVVFDVQAKYVNHIEKAIKSLVEKKFWDNDDWNYLSR